MLIYIGADHRGFRLKESLKQYLKSTGYEIVDVGNENLVEGDDYPDFAAIAARKVSLDPVNSRAILICGSGVGMDIVANKFQNVRSVLAFSPDQAASSRSDDNTNALCFAADYIEEDEAQKITTAWISTEFSGDERHKRRLRKIEDIENRKMM